MVTLKEVDEQLERQGLSFRFWGRAEVVELAQILIPGEQIKACLNGRYEGGFALLCATDQRVLLVDKKLFHLTVEDIRYDMIAEVDFNMQFYSAGMRVCTPNKTLAFRSFKPKSLRSMVSYLQQRVMEIRQQYTFPAQNVPVQPMLVQSRQQPPQYSEQHVATAALAGELVPELPMPQFRNPYTRSSLLIRRRVGRFSRPVPDPQS